jgi:LysM repeat protein
MMYLFRRWVRTASVVLMLLSPSVLQATSDTIPRLFNVRSGETVARYAKWTGVSRSTIRKMVGIAAREELRKGMGIRLDLTDDQWRRFQKRRGRKVAPAASRQAPDSERVQIAVGQGSQGMLPARTHAIEPGEYGWQIAFQYGISLNRLREANGGPDFRGFRAGRILVIPERSAKQARRYVVKHPLVIRGKDGETLALLSQWSKVPVSKLMSINQIKDEMRSIVGRLLKVPIDELEWKTFQAKRQR